MEAKKSILIVDDEKMLLEVLNKMLENNYDVGLAHSASNAIHYLNNNNKVDCILLDITMPNITGFDFLNDIRKIPSYHKVPIIIISGNTGQEFFDQARKSSAFDVLTKPVKKELLIETIERSLAK